ncbi:hypothetical protein BDV96DRAFT_587616 [Lophiotrema nucula]|uniref:Rhodopsin domain-containing protein n=1 Tax=Lophiotrema nucula TaxID=690887 RepID=A0A6A5YM28_9PLEO|nr:hypothetical protein BDV96DRAFT_587616 [Lophiotrema nucula]
MPYVARNSTSQHEHSHQWLIDHSTVTAVVPRKTFEVLIWTFLGLSILATASRFAIRIKSRGRLVLDDYFLIPALLATCVTAPLLNKALPGIYVTEAVGAKGNISLNASDIEALAENMKWTFVYTCTSWTTIFCVKYSFLAFFHGMITPVFIHLTRYFWFVVGYCIVTFVLCLVEPLAICHSWGKASLHQCSNQPFALIMAIGLVVLLLDIIGDIMIISIPLLILSMTGLRPAQKAVLGSSLCLSVVMIVIAGIRTGEFRSGSRHQMDFLWGMFWQFIEGAVAILMASVTVYRSVFVDAHRKAEQKRHQEYQPRKISLLGWSPRGSPRTDDILNSTTRPSHIPGIAMAGLESVVNTRGSTRIPGITKKPYMDEASNIGSGNLRELPPSIHGSV